MVVEVGEAGARSFASTLNEAGAAAAWTLENVRQICRNGVGVVRCLIAMVRDRQAIFAFERKTKTLLLARERLPPLNQPHLSY